MVSDATTSVFADDFEDGDFTTPPHIFVWKTDRGWTKSCRKLIARRVDGTDHVAYFNFGK